MRKFVTQLLIPFNIFCCLLAATILFASCAGTKKAFNPNKSFTKKQLQQDYTLFRKILEDAHPSLYWYTPKDSMDYYFDAGYKLIGDSMTESQFRTLLSFVISRVNCGHTTVRYSKEYAKYIDTVRQLQFPLGIKFWDDSAFVFNNINRRDSVLRRGVRITSINHLPIGQVRDSLFNYLSTDGYSMVHKYQSLSNPGNFGGLFQAVYGSRNNFDVNYIDSSGTEKTTSFNLFDYRRDSSYRNFVRARTGISKKDRKEMGLANSRSLQIDTAGNTAFMTLSTFSNGNRLRSFFRKSFRQLKEDHIKNLVIDLRSNGGGNVSLSTKLTQYLADHDFKLADSLYASKRLSTYEKYIQNTWQAFFFMNVVTSKRSDGNYHFGYFERHFYKPKKHNHFNGNVYVLTGGNSFSASTLFVHALQGQSNVKIVGEETGGGAYGNTAWFIPDATLPNTHVRFRLPRFRMVMNKYKMKDGHGIIPDIVVKPSSEAIRNGYDAKIEYLRKLIYGK